MIFKYSKLLMRFLWEDCDFISSPVLGAKGFAFSPLNLLALAVAVTDPFERLADGSNDKVVQASWLGLGIMLSLVTFAVTYVPAVALCLAAFTLSVLATVVGGPIAFAADLIANIPFARIGDFFASCFRSKSSDALRKAMDSDDSDNDKTIHCNSQSSQSESSSAAVVVRINNLAATNNAASAGKAMPEQKDNHCNATAAITSPGRKQKNLHSCNNRSSYFTSLQETSKNSGLIVDVSDDEMANSAFGQASNTAKRLRFNPSNHS